MNLYESLKNQVVTFLESNKSYIPNKINPLVITVQNKKDEKDVQIGLIWNFIDHEFYDLITVYQFFPSDYENVKKSIISKRSNFESCLIDLLCEFKTNEYYQNSLDSEKYDFKVQKFDMVNFENLLTSPKKNEIKIFETIKKIVGL